MSPLAPGTPVIYRGSLTAYHGPRVAHPCECSRCFQRKLNGQPVLRYDLWPADGRRPHNRFPEHAGRASLTPIR